MASESTFTQATMRRGVRQACLACGGTENLSYCAGCTMVKLCSPQCARSSWSSHKKACKALACVSKCWPEYIRWLVYISGVLPGVVNVEVEEDSVKINIRDTSFFKGPLKGREVRLFQLDYMTG